MKMLTALLAGLAVALVAPARADALSCAPSEPIILHAEHAFIGDLVAHDGALLTFHVRDVVRGELPEQLVVRDDLAPRDDFAPGWGMTVPVGAEVGLVVRSVGGEFLANQCELVAPERLRLARRGGWPRGVVLDVGPGHVLTGGTTVRVKVRCEGLCAGQVALRARDGTLLARRRVALREPATTIARRLRRDARRRVQRRGVLQTRATVRLDTVEPLVARPVTVVLDPGAPGRSSHAG